MAGKSQAHADTVLGILRGTNVTAQATYYLGLLKANPSADDMTGAVETTYTNYARQALTSASAWSAISGTKPRSQSNAGLITFPTAGATGDTITGFFIAKTSSTSITTAGEVLYWNVLTGGNKVVNPSDPVTVPVGGLTVTES